MKHKLESRLPGERSITSDMQMTPPLWQKAKRNWRPSWWKRGEWKTWLNTQHSKNKDHGIQSHHFMANRWGNSGNSDRLICLGSKITAVGDCSHESKRHLLLGRKAMTNLDSILKSRDITLLIKVHLVKAMVFPIIMYGCEKVKVKVVQSCQLFAIPWTIQSMEFSRPEYWRW